MIPEHGSDTDMARDEEARTFVIDGFQGGLNTEAPPNKVAINQGVSLQNVFVSEYGVATRRPGLTQIGTISNAGNTTSAQVTKMIAAGHAGQRKVYLIYTVQRAVGGQIYGWDGTAWRGPNAFGTFHWETDAVWVRESDGTERIYAPSASSIGTTYPWWKIALSATGSIPAAGAAGDLNTDPPDDCTVALNYADRVFGGGIYDSNRHVLFYSRVYPNLETWDRAKNWISFGGNRGEAITGLGGFRDNMIFVGMENSCHLLNVGTGSVLDWMITTVSSDIGVGSHRSIANVGEDLYFMDQHGNVRSLLRTLQEGGSSVRSVPISLPIKDATDTIDPAFQRLSTAAFFNDRYWFSFTTSSTARLHYTYNIITKAWEGPHVFKDASGNQIYIQEMEVSYVDPGGTGFLGTKAAHLYLAGSTGLAEATAIQVYELDSTVFQDAAAEDIDFEFITAALNFEAPHQEKEIDWVELEMEKVSGTSGSVDLYGRCDFGDWMLIESAIDYTDILEVEAIRFPIQGKLGRGRTFQFKITCDDTATNPKISRILINVKFIAPK
jgi:hypothetical protein